MHLSTINKLIKRYHGVNIGYSGHEKPNDTFPSILALTLGAKSLKDILD